MRTRLTLLAMLMMLAGLANAQNKKRPKAKKPVLPKDSIYGYHLVPKFRSDEPFILRMPVDSLRAGNVKIPNSYRKGLVEPVPMPTHKVEMVKPKRQE